MKHLLLSLLAVLAFVACNHNEVEELTTNRAAIPGMLTVGFEGANDTRIQLNEACKTVWNKGDEVSVFYQSYTNMKWLFQGNDGDNSGALKTSDNNLGEQVMDEIIIVYPYNADYRVNLAKHAVMASLPAEQSYKEGSYGKEGNIMVASSEYRNFVLKSICGWLRVELTGEGQKVSRITLRGNNNEQVAGDIYIHAEDATVEFATFEGSGTDNDMELSGDIRFENESATEITLNCGSGVELDAQTTAFYIAVLPQTFSKGITIEVECEECEPMTIGIDSSVTIERNHIVPMNGGNYDDTVPSIANSEIRYTSTGKIWAYNGSDFFNVAILSHEWDETTGEGVITFDGELTMIGDWAFGDDFKPITSITIPDSVTTIGSCVFTMSPHLIEFKGKFASDNGRCLIIDNTFVAYAEASGTEYTIPYGVTTIGEGAFYLCNSLTSIVIPDSVTTIGYRTFGYCESLTSVTIPDSVTTIGDWAFDGCSSLTSVTIPDSVTAIEEGAFDGCSSLTSVTIPDSVTTIGDRVFGKCSNLAEFKGKFAADGGRCLIKDNAIIAYAEASGTTYTIPDSVTTIGVSAFDGCRSLTSVTIPNSVTTIGGSAFYGCNSLTSVTIPDSVTTIGNWAFDGCQGSLIVNCNIPDKTFQYADFSEVIIGNSVTTIGESAFESCHSLTSVTIPNSVTTIGSYAFYGCDNLTSVYCKAVTPPELEGSLTFYRNADGRKIYVPTAITYKKASGWRGYDSDIVGYDFEKGEILVAPQPESNQIGYIGTSKVTPNKSNVFGASIISNEWNGLTGLGLITFDRDVTTIGDEAFNNCDNLTEIIIPDSVTAIGEEAFASCYYLTSITIGDSVTTIEYRAFGGCSKLAEFKGKFAADGGRCLIKDNTIIAYAEASGTTYTIPDSVTTIGYYAFYSCDSLTSVTIPDSVTTIGDYAFYSCDSLTSVTIPDSVTTIANQAFYSCKNLQQVFCRAVTPASLGTSTFSQWGAGFSEAIGCTIYVPAEAVDAYKVAENWSDYASYIVAYDFETGEVVAQ